MGQAVDIHRLHFAFTITFHYIFSTIDDGTRAAARLPETKALRPAMNITTVRHDSGRGSSGLILRLGVVTGIPMEFQFGTNWAAFSKTAGGVIGQTLAMEGVFSFFFSNRVSWDCFCSVRKNLDASGIGGQRFCFSRLMALGLFIVVTGRVDATRHCLRVLAPTAR